MALSAALRADPSELLWGPGGGLPCPAASHSQGTQPSQPQTGWPEELGQTLNTEKGLITSTGEQASWEFLTVSPSLPRIL